MKSNNLIPVLLISIIVNISINGQSSNPADSVMAVMRCNDFEVTGNGSDVEWEKTTWQDLNQAGSSSSYKTRMKMLYSEKGIYCLYFCEDSKITATMKGDNLDLWNEDVIEAFFWADPSVPVYFEYELSPLNQELILMVPNYNGRFLGWIPWHYEGDRVTRHAVAIIKNEDKIEGWSGEFFIPYELLKPMVGSAPKKGDKWRANFYRIDYDDNQAAWLWMPVVNNFHDYLLFGTLEFR